MKNIKSYPQAISESYRMVSGKPFLDLDVMLWYAAETGDAYEIDRLISMGAKTDYKRFDQRGNTPLHAAAENAHPDAVRTLLKAGANAKAKNSYKRTPLHCVLMRGGNTNKRTEIVEMLINAGGAIDARNENGDTAVMLVVRDGEYSNDVLRMLIDAGADLDIKNDVDETPLIKSVKWERFKPFMMLIEGGAKVNEKDKWRNSALQYAVNTKNPTYAKTLVLAGANIEGVFGSPREVIDFFGSDVGWWPDPAMKEQLTRVSKVRNIFGK